MFVNRTFAFFVALAVTLVSVGSLDASASQFKFTNNTGKKADDLHIEFNRAVTWEGATPEQDPEDTFKEAGPKDKNNVNFASGITGDGVDDKKSVVITFEYDGTKPKVKKYRWTNANSLEPGRGDYISLPDAGDTMAISFPGAGSGDGEYLVLIDDEEHFFNTQADEEGPDTATRFADWFEGLPFAELISVEGDTVEVTSRSYGLGYSVLLEVVLPDSSQDVICETTPIYQEPHFTRGDIDGDGVVVALIDVMFLLELGFGDATIDPPCTRALDVNQDDKVGYLVDAMTLLNWQYNGGDLPPAPAPGECGTDVESPLSCDNGGIGDSDSDGVCD